MHQYLFFVGDFPIRAYGLILSLSIILATGVAYFLAKQDGRWHNHIVDIGIYSGIAGVVGARLWDVFFFDWAYYSHHLSEIFYVWQGGMAIQGGIVFGVGAGIIYARRHKIDILALADIVAPTGSNFGIIYPETTLAYHTYGAQPLWPAEVWEGQIDFVIFALLLIFRAFPHAKGQAFSLYIMLYSLARFGLEFLRGDYATPVFLSFTSAQTTSLVAFILALIFFIYCQITYSRQKKTVKSKINKNRIKNKRGY